MVAIPALLSVPFATADWTRTGMGGGRTIEEGGCDCGIGRAPRRAGAGSSATLPRWPGAANTLYGRSAKPHGRNAHHTFGKRPHVMDFNEQQRA